MSEQVHKFISAQVKKGSWQVHKGLSTQVGKRLSIQESKGLRAQVPKRLSEQVLKKPLHSQTLSVLKYLSTYALRYLPT